MEISKPYLGFEIRDSGRKEQLFDSERDSVKQAKHNVKIVPQNGV